ncbi:MAG TPA: hypothetical protein VHE10_02495 [Candidatus Paceibacterota bacterium]|nr:hypothetical protein [Candidatus Paceibacterota bacterium]
MNTTTTVSADELIKQKAAEIEKELAAWAEANRIVDAGERLVFSLRLVRVPIVVCEDARNVTALPKNLEKISPRDVYDATRRVMATLKSVRRLNQNMVESELNAPGLVQFFHNSWKGIPYRKAYQAAKANKPFAEGERS